MVEAATFGLGALRASLAVVAGQKRPQFELYWRWTTAQNNHSSIHNNSHQHLEHYISIEIINVGSNTAVDVDFELRTEFLRRDKKQKLSEYAGLFLKPHPRVPPSQSFIVGYFQHYEFFEGHKKTGPSSYTPTDFREDPIIIDVFYDAPKSLLNIPTRFKRRKARSMYHDELYFTPKHIWGDLPIKAEN